MAEYKYLSIKQVLEDGRFPFSIGQIRHFLLNRHRNRLETAVRKIGRRLYLRDDLFEQWLEIQGGGR